MLTQLLAELEIERKPTVRDRLVSAILPGAKLITLKGRRTGGSFRVAAAEAVPLQQPRSAA